MLLTSREGSVTLLHFYGASRIVVEVRLSGSSTLPAKLPAMQKLYFIFQHHEQCK
ncbi:hypothetical protein BGY98DRAFT_993273 [Russula aff. rugulosa BPL654]|nr:hypothetical protein BGY98DRAFT_993273 [Russula aff. rugulosa BPL654]